MAIACLVVDAARAQGLAPNVAGSREQALAAGAAALAQRVPGVEIERSALTGAPDLVSSVRGALTAAAPGKSSDAIVREFLAENRALYGLDSTDLDDLVTLGDSPGGRSGLRMLRLEQRVGGVPVFLSETRFLLDRDGRLWRSVGTLIPGAAASAPSVDRTRLRSAADALVSLLAVDAVQIDAADVVVRDLNAQRAELLAPKPVAGPASAQLVLFPRARGVLVPAWSLTVFTSGEEDWYAVVDAQSGELLWRTNLREHASTQAARFSVYVAADGKTPADSPAPQSPSPAVPGAGTQYPGIARTTVNMLTVQDLTASPNGWIDDCPGGVDRCDTTTGNNANVCLDRDATDDVCDGAALDLAGRPQGNPDASARNRDFLGAAPRDFDYSPAPLAGNPNAGDAPTNPDSQRGAAVQVFYLCNWYHDRLYNLGFDEPSGNFQQVNLHGAGGVAGDRVTADLQNLGTNGGSSSTPADGAGPLRIQFGIYPGPSPDRDADLDATLVLHELTHGLSHRLVGNSTGLLWDPARSMGEGWSDFYALALLNATNADDPNGSYNIGAWSNYMAAGFTDNYVYGIRAFPYNNNNAINPLTWADVDAVTADTSGGIAPSPFNISAAGVMEVHYAGAIWAQTLWEVRARIIADPAGANGDVPAGNETMLQLVTDALKMTPANPSFIAGRDAMLAADCATNACANERSIWAGFADRGLGYNAIAPLTELGRFALGHMGVGTSFATPYLDVVAPAAAVVVNDAALGNGDGRLDPGETATLTIALSNPWRAAGATVTNTSATLTSTTPGVTINDATANYPSIAPLTSAGNSDPFQVTLSNALACAQSVEFDLQTVSSLGNHSVHFALRIGTPGGAGAPVTYTAVPNLAIPVSKPDGVSSNLVIGDDREIADLNFRVDSLTFPVTGHLTVMLRAPSGYGSDLIWRRGGLAIPNQGNGADFTNLVIDDDLPFAAAEDLNQSQSSQAPFTGDWLPAYNSPFWNTYRPTPPNPPAPVSSDPIGQLARLDGSSTKGTWTINVANGSNTLTGTLGSWSLIVAPRTYSCTVFSPAVLFADGFE